MNVFPIGVVLAFASINFPIPQEYQGGAVVTVHFVDTQEEIDSACGKAPAGMTKLGCETEAGELVVPNPCSYPEAKNDDSFAHLMCHEKAHKNGWRHR